MLAAIDVANLLLACPSGSSDGGGSGSTTGNGSGPTSVITTEDVLIWDNSMMTCTRETVTITNAIPGAPVSSSETQDVCC